MSTDSDKLVQEYLQIFNAYVTPPSDFSAYFGPSNEQALQQGNDLGRRAIRIKSGLLEILEAHHKGLSMLPMIASTDLVEQINHSWELLSNCIIPFEMTQRGYKETTNNLQRINSELLNKIGEVSLLNEEMESFSHSISHDLRSPLQQIKEATKTLFQKNPDLLDQNSIELINRITTATDQMSLVIESLLSLSHLSQQEIDRKPVDLSSVAESIIKDLKSNDPRRKVSVNVGKNLKVIGDEPLLRSVLKNLIGNAWKFTSKKQDAHIEINQTEKDGITTYFVKDDGAGFDMKYVSKLFRTFQRLHPKEEFPGIGLGLATAKRIISRHNGKIWADGVVNQGATIYFSLPSVNPSSKT